CNGCKGISCTSQTYIKYFLNYVALQIGYLRFCHSDHDNEFLFFYRTCLSLAYEITGYSRHIQYQTYFTCSQQGESTIQIDLIQWFIQRLYYYILLPI